MIDTPRPLKVFLCHASADKPAVRLLYRRLKDDGVQPWLDAENLIPGQNWRVEIPKAVRDADVVLVCLSCLSVDKEGYVQKEIKLALDVADEKPEGTIFVIPARLEDCPVPERLSTYQWVDLFEKDGYDRLHMALQVRAEQIGARSPDRKGKFTRPRPAQKPVKPAVQDQNPLPQKEIQVEPVRKPPSRLEGLLILSFALFALARFLYEVVASFLLSYLYGLSEDPIIGATIYAVSYGVFVGILTAFIIYWILVKAGVQVKRRNAWLMAALWAAGITIPIWLCVNLYRILEIQGSWWWNTCNAIAGLANGMVIALVLRRAVPAFSTKRVLIVALGWAIGFGISEIALTSFYEQVLDITGNETFAMWIVSPFHSAIIGLIGAWATLSQLDIGRGYTINWKTVISGCLGFTLGNILSSLFTSFISPDVDLVIRGAIWGLVAGVFLAYPARKPWVYMILGVLGGIGLALAALIPIALELIVIIALIYGVLFGLFIGSYTKSVSRLFIIAVISAIALLLRYQVYTAIMSLGALLPAGINTTISRGIGSLVAGFMISLIFSYFRNKEIPAAQPQALGERST